MSRIEEMIAEMCPDGVEYCVLKNVVTINRGKRVTKKELSEDAPYIAYHGSKDTPLGRYHKSNAPADTTIVVNTGSVGGVKYCSEAFWCSDGSYWLSSDKFASKFLYYYLQQYEKYFMENKREGGVPTLDKTLLENIRLPLLPIEIQNEIVRVLETFEELEAELEGRKKQYEYYRNLLLTFDSIGEEREKEN